MLWQCWIIEPGIRTNEIRRKHKIIEHEYYVDWIIMETERNKDRIKYNIEDTDW